MMKMYRLFGILILALIMLFSLLSCGESGQSETTFESISQSGTSLETPLPSGTVEPLPSGTVDEAHPLLEKTVDEIKEIYGIDPFGVDTISTFPFWFFVDESGCPTIAEFGYRDNIRYVATITVFPARTEAPSNENLEKVVDGKVTIYELVALFGIPTHTSDETSSFETVSYQSIEGDWYTFVLRIK